METTSEETASAPASEGNIDELKRQNAGLIADLQKERASRQSYEQMIQEIRTRSTATPPPPAATTTEEEDPSVFINEVNAKGKRAVLPLVQEEMKPLKKTLDNLSTLLDRNKSLAWLARQESVRTGKMVFAEDLEDSDLQKELIAVARENNLLNMTWTDGTKASYQILLKRRQDADAAKKAEEALRETRIAGSTTETTRSSSAPTGVRRYSKTEFRSLLDKIDPRSPSAGDQALLVELKAAVREGRVIADQK